MIKKSYIQFLNKNIGSYIIINEELLKIKEVLQNKNQDENCVIHYYNKTRIGKLNLESYESICYQLENNLKHNMIIKEGFDTINLDCPPPCLKIPKKFQTKIDELIK